jgi:hypothetical protein
MKKITVIVFSLSFIISAGIAQSVGIGTNTPDANAILHLESTNQGLLLPNIASFTRESMVNPPSGLLLYDYNTKSLWTRGATTWNEILTPSNSPWLEDNGNVYRSTGFVGIGTATPYNRLQVHNSLNDSNFIRITNSVSGLTATDGLLIGARGTGAAIINRENGSLLLGTNNDTIMSVNTNGRIGIGNLTPAAALQINAFSNNTNPTLLLTDSSGISSGRLKFRQLNNTVGMMLSGYTENNFNAGQYLDVRSDSLYVATFRGNGRLGINNTNPLHTLDVGGDINTSGLIRMNGDAGISGQVLTSNGIADPTWGNVAYNNNIRFSFNFSQMSGALGEASDSLNFNGTPPNYNLNPAMVSVVPGNNARIVINKTGLYHFSGSVSMINSNIIPSISIGPNATLGYWINNKNFAIESGPTNSLVGYVPDDDFIKIFQFSFDVYITAGQTLKFTRLLFVDVGGFHSTTGHVNGYLISE